MAAEARARMLAAFKPKPMVCAAPESEPTEEEQAALKRLQWDAWRAKERARRQRARGTGEWAPAAIPEPQAPILVATEVVAHAEPVRYSARDDTLDSLTFKPKDPASNVPTIRGETSKLTRSLLVGLQGNRCYLCHELFEPRTVSRCATVDHVTPVSMGGANQGNRLMAHRCCNEVKADRMPTAEELAYLEEINGRMAMMGRRG